MKYYKVVSHKNGRYFSAIVKNCSLFMLEADWQIEYKIGKAILPYKNSKLMCFDSIDNAIDFKVANQHLAYNQDWQIFEIEVINPIEGMGEQADFDDFWNQYNLNHQLFTDSNFPRGTIFCDSIKLIERIQ